MGILPTTAYPILLLVLFTRCSSAVKFSLHTGTAFQVSSTGWHYGVANSSMSASWSSLCHTHIYIHPSLSVVPAHKHLASFALLLLLSGDVECNPGPRQPKYPCGMCSKAVKNSDPAVCCDQCDAWVHNRCSGLSELMYEVLIYGAI